MHDEWIVIFYSSPYAGYTNGATIIIQKHLSENISALILYWNLDLTFVLAPGIILSETFIYLSIPQDFSQYGITEVSEDNNCSSSLAHL